MYQEKFISVLEVSYHALRNLGCRDWEESSIILVFYDKTRNITKNQDQIEG